MKQSKWTTWLAALALAASLAGPMAMMGQAPYGEGQAAPKAGAEKGERGERAERHPAIREAIRHLERAKAILEKQAAHDFGGHRVKAIQDIDQALAQLREALEFDKK